MDNIRLRFLPTFTYAESLFAPVRLALLYAALCSSLFGCGVVPGTGDTGRIVLAADTTTIAPGGRTHVSVSAIGIPASSITLSLQCDMSHCGTLSGSEFIAPAPVASNLQVKITATSNVHDAIPANLMLTVVPPPQLLSVVPNALEAGTTQRLRLYGSGFVSGSTVSIDSSGTGISPVLTNVKVIDSATIMATITTPPEESGFAAIRIVEQVPLAFASSPIAISITPSVDSSPALQVFNVNSYSASGSSKSYMCSGQSGALVITCDQSVLDFVADQGVRIATGGPAPRVPSVTAQPLVQQQKHILSGPHTYCYIVIAADPEGGVTPPSPASCIDNEPDLSFATTYNNLSGTYSLPLSQFLWYVSKDGSPFQLLDITTGGDVAQDVGQQPGSRGGWPVTLSASNPDMSKNEDLFTSVASVRGNQLTLTAPLQSTVQSVIVDHDDTGAAQFAIDAAVAAGGGIIKFGVGTYNIRRPCFGYWTSDSNPYPTYTTDYSRSPSYGSFWNLCVANGATGNIYIEGQGSATVLQAGPDLGGGMFALGVYSTPASAPFKSIEIEPVDKGSTKLVLADSSVTGGLHPGSDVWLYSGSFGGTCIDSNGTAGGGCHFSELNTIEAIQGNTLTLEYPTSKKYYDDGVDSFGLVKLPTTLHNIALQNLTINTYNRVIGPGYVYGLLINKVVVNGSPAEGAFVGGYKRDVVIENSSWNIGTEDATWNGTEEFDQFTDVAFIGNTITGNSPDSSNASRIYLTEGTSQIMFEDNTISHVSIYFQDTTDDVIRGNIFHNGDVTIGKSYNEFGHPLEWGNPQDASFLSFGSQTSASISGNSFTIDSAFTPPWVINLGHFDHGGIDGNVIVYDAGSPLAAINSDGGYIGNNTVTLGPLATSSWGIAVIPDEGPGIAPSNFIVAHNTVNATVAAGGIYIVNAGFSDPAPICLEQNTINIQKGKSQFIPDSTNLSCDGSK